MGRISMKGGGMRLKVSPHVAINIPHGIFYGREVLYGIFDYVHSHRPWVYVTGSVGSPQWDFPPKTQLPAVIGMFAEGDFVNRMEKKGVPVVNVSERVEDVGAARVLPDNLEAGRMAARYFIEKKFSHFAYSGYSGFAFSIRRQTGFEETLKQAGHSCFIQNFGEGHWPRDSMEALPEIIDWLAELPKPIAIFAGTDDHARRILNQCMLGDLRVPEDVAVLGCDNDQIECELSGVPLSSVSFPLRQLGYQAAALVERLLSGEPPPEGGTLRMAPTGIITRRSTDIIAVNDPVVAKAVGFISAHASDPIDVGDVVKICGASRRYLERRFTSVLGHTPKQEILRVRIANVKRLLSETNLCMPDIAEATGFTDSKILSAIFVRNLGMTPSEYRRRLRAELP